MTGAASPEPFRALAALGAGEFAHLNGSLERHLVSVYDLLRGWEADDVLCGAGLFHAAYGTAGFAPAMIASDQRAKVAAIVGPDAERVVYRYCSCDRASVWPQVGVAAPVRFRDRFTGATDSIGEDELRRFCELTCANEVQIAQDDRTFAIDAGRYLRQLFRGWGNLLSQSALRAMEAAFPAQ